MNSPPEIIKLYIEAGIKKVKLPLPKMFVLGIYAGMYIALGGLCSSTCVYAINSGNANFFSGLIFPIGLTLCLCAGAELFTGNCLLVIPLFCKKITIVEMLISWGMVYLGNFFGSFLMAILIVYGHVPNLFNNNLAQFYASIATAKVSFSFGDIFIRSIICNSCVCLAVWLSFGAKDLFSKIAGLWSPILLFVACAFEHCVANMFIVPLGLLATYEYNIERNELDWGRFFYKNLIPVTLGNIIGGVLIVGFIYWFIYATEDSSNFPPQMEKTAASQAVLINNIGIEKEKKIEHL